MICYLTFFVAFFNLFVVISILDFIFSASTSYFFFFIIFSDILFTPYPINEFPNSPISQVVLNIFPTFSFAPFSPTSPPPNSWHVSTPVKSLIIPLVSPAKPIVEVVIRNTPLSFIAPSMYHQNYIKKNLYMLFLLIFLKLD